MNPDLHENASYAPEIHRLLPQAGDAERGVLSSFFLSPFEVGEKLDELQITPGHFHLPAHALIFATMIEMWHGKKPIDILTVTQLLRDRNQLEEAGGAALVT